MHRHNQAALEEGRKLNDLWGAAAKVAEANILLDNYKRMKFLSNLPILREEAKEKDKKRKERRLQTFEGRIEALGESSDHNGLVLTAEQWQFEFNKAFASALENFGLRSPQYYHDKSQCLSVGETAWPAIIGFEKAHRLKRGYIEPKDLIERLHKLKPSENFELRKPAYNGYFYWTDSPLLEEKGHDERADYPWHLVQKRWGLTKLYTSLYRLEQKLCDRWERAIYGVQSPVPDLHLLKDMGHSPAGTLFPWYLVQGLMALRKDANDKGTDFYDEEYDIAVGKRKEAIYRWKKRHPDSILLHDLASICRTWPADLMDELDEIDRESVRCGRRKYIAHLRETEKKMQTLVTFWRDCKAVTGQRIQPKSWWHDEPILRVKRLPKPQHLKDRLLAITREFGGDGNPEGNRLRMRETVFWMESLISGDCESVASDTTFPQSLLDELGTIWRYVWLDSHRYDWDDTEDEMLAAIRRWRESQYQPRSEEGGPTLLHLSADAGQEELLLQADSPGCPRNETLSRSSASGSVLIPGERRQLRAKLSQGSRPRSRRKSTMGEDQAIWRDRLLPRRSVVDASRERPKGVERSIGKPKGVTKRYSRKESKKKRPAAAKGRATTSAAQKADPVHVPNRHYHFRESFLRAVPSKVTKARGINLRRRSPRDARGAREESITKTSSGNHR